MKFKYLIKSIYLLIVSSSYVIFTNKGSSFMVPEDRELLENIQDELNILDEHLEELITDLILEERDN